jgi:hypothetical protein
LQPADIIFAVDTSGSMGEESYYVRSELNGFSQQIIASGIDVRVIMLAEPPPPFFPCSSPLFCPPGICIDPPLGSGGCPNQDTNPPLYIHVPNTEVNSTDGLNVFYDEYSKYKAELRPDASKTLVVITDDDASQGPYNNATKFVTDYTALDPVLLKGWKMSGIYCHSDCSSAASIGKVWKDVIDQTGGLHGDLCKQEFKPIFDDLAQAIIVGSQSLPCQYDIPAPPMNQTLDPNKVNVRFTDGAMTEQDILHVTNEAACDPVTGGWYYGDNANPKTIYLCTASCDVVSSDPDGKIDILFGCKTKIAPPK